jgi:hypothetical protein
VKARLKDLGYVVAAVPVIRRRVHLSAKLAEALETRLTAATGLNGW